MSDRRNEIKNSVKFYKVKSFDCMLQEPEIKCLMSDPHLPGKLVLFA